MDLGCGSGILSDFILKPTNDACPNINNVNDKIQNWNHFINDNQIDIQLHGFDCSSIALTYAKKNNFFQNYQIIYQVSIFHSFFFSFVLCCVVLCCVRAFFCFLLLVVTKVYRSICVCYFGTLRYVFCKCHCAVVVVCFCNLFFLSTYNMKSHTYTHTHRDTQTQTQQRKIYVEIH